MLRIPISSTERIERLEVPIPHTPFSSLKNALSGILIFGAIDTDHQ